MSALTGPTTRQYAANRCRLRASVVAMRVSVVTSVRAGPYRSARMANAIFAWPGSSKAANASGPMATGCSSPTFQGSGHRAEHDLARTLGEQREAHPRHVVEAEGRSRRRRSAAHPGLHATRSGAEHEKQPYQRDS